MFKPLIFVFSVIVFLSGCSLFSSDKDVRKPIGDGLSPKALYELAEDKIDAGSRYLLSGMSYEGKRVSSELLDWDPRIVQIRYD